MYLFGEGIWWVGIIKTITILQLVEVAGLKETPVLADALETQTYILTQLATTFSEDRDFLRKINKLSFGLISQG